MRRNDLASAEPAASDPGAAVGGDARTARVDGTAVDLDPGGDPAVPAGPARRDPLAELCRRLVRGTARALVVQLGARVRRLRAGQPGVLLAGRLCLRTD